MTKKKISMKKIFTKQYKRNLLLLQKNGTRAIIQAAGQTSFPRSWSAIQTLALRHSTFILSDKLA